MRLRRDVIKPNSSTTDSFEIHLKPFMKGEDEDTRRNLQLTTCVYPTQSKDTSENQLLAVTFNAKDIKSRNVAIQTDTNELAAWARKQRVEKQAQRRVELIEAILKDDRTAELLESGLKPKFCIKYQTAPRPAYLSNAAKVKFRQNLYNNVLLKRNHASSKVLRCEIACSDNAVTSTSHLGVADRSMFDLNIMDTDGSMDFDDWTPPINANKLSLPKEWTDYGSMKYWEEECNKQDEFLRCVRKNLGKPYAIINNTDAATSSTVAHKSIVSLEQIIQLCLTKQCFVSLERMPEIERVLTSHRSIVNNRSCTPPTSTTLNNFKLPPLDTDSLPKSPRRRSLRLEQRKTRNFKL